MQSLYRNGRRQRGQTAHKNAEIASQSADAEGRLSGACLRGRTAAQRSGCEKGSQKGSGKGAFQNVPRTPPLEECAPSLKKGCSRHRKSFMHRVCSAWRGMETMVSDHDLGRGQTMGEKKEEKKKNYSNQFRKMNRFVKQSAGIILGRHACRTKLPPKMFLI